LRAGEEGVGGAGIGEIEIRDVAGDDVVVLAAQPALDGRTDQTAIAAT